MKVCDYPALIQHAEIHQQLVSQVEVMRNRSQQGKTMALEMLKLLTLWLVDHIHGDTDRLIAPYCAGKEELIKQALELDQSNLKQNMQINDEPPRVVALGQYNSQFSPAAKA